MTAIQTRYEINSRNNVNKVFRVHFVFCLHWGNCLEIYSHTLLFHLLHIIVIRWSNFLFKQTKSIRRHQTNTIWITQIHPGQDRRSRVELNSLPQSQHGKRGTKTDMPLSSQPLTIVFYHYFNILLIRCLKFTKNKSKS